MVGRVVTFFGDMCWVKMYGGMAYGSTWKVTWNSSWNESVPRNCFYPLCMAV